MAWYDFITGVDVQKNIDHVASGVDMMFYTDEEKAIQMAKINEMRLRAIEKSSVARRVIAIAITFESLLLVNVAIVLRLMGLIQDSTFVLGVLTGFMLQPFLAVVGFYFLTAIVGAKK